MVEFDDIDHQQLIIFARLKTSHVSLSHFTGQIHSTP